VKGDHSGTKAPQEDAAEYIAAFLNVEKLIVADSGAHIAGAWLEPWPVRSFWPPLQGPVSPVVRCRRLPL
jgi:hypothetical protein